MPTVGRIGGLRVVIYPNDHRPAHVHVIGADCEALFRLGGAGRKAALIENYGFSGRELMRIETELTHNLKHLQAEWRRIHGGR